MVLMKLFNTISSFTLLLITKLYTVYVTKTYQKLTIHPVLRDASAMDQFVVFRIFFVVFSKKVENKIWSSILAILISSTQLKTTGDAILDLFEL